MLNCPLFTAEVLFDLTEVLDIGGTGRPHFEADGASDLFPGDLQHLAAPVGTNPDVAADARVNGHHRAKLVAWLGTASDSFPFGSLFPPEGNSHAWLERPAPGAALTEHRPSEPFIVLEIDETLLRGRPDAESPLNLLIQGRSLLDAGVIRVAHQGARQLRFPTEHMHVRRDAGSSQQAVFGSI